MINSELSEISYVIQAGVTTYPIGFEYHFNENNSPQLLVKIGESVAIINVDFQLSADESEIILIPTEEEARAQTSPNDTRWMDRIVGKELLITRDIPFVQTSDYTVGRISPEQIEYDFDRTVMRDQEILHRLSDFTVDVALAESLANAAVETANEAATAANQATATANTALETANTALETANTAIVTSNDAKSVATQASQDAVDAIADSANAVNKAEAATEMAAHAVTLAQGAWVAVDNKQDKLTAGTNVSIVGTTINVDGYSKAQVDNKVRIIEADVDANADAIQKTRADFISADSDIHTILNNHAGELTTLHNDVDAVGDQISGIEEKIPGTASASNPLITKQQLLDEEMDIREDLNSGLSELQTQVTAQAANIATKQDKLIAGDNIVISGNVISATGAGGGVGFDVTVVQELPESGEKGIIYLVPKDGAALDIYDEYVWVTTTSTFELIGSTKVDLSDYLPLSGGTLTGPLELYTETKEGDYFGSDSVSVLKGRFDAPDIDKTTTFVIQMSQSSSGFTLSDAEDSAYGIQFRINGSNTCIVPSISTPKFTIGDSGHAWKTVYTTMINNGADLIVPTEGGTLARLEDLADIGGTSLPDQTGNAGKVLRTNGTDTEWTDDYLPLSGGTLAGPLETTQVFPSENKRYTLGMLSSMYRIVFTRAISCSSAGELLLPDVGGTLARIEDIKQIQVLEFPENAPENSIFQYVGETNDEYTYGYFYTNKGSESELLPEFTAGSDYVSDPDVLFTKVYSDLGLEPQVGDSFILNVNHGSAGWANFVQIRLTRDGTETEKYITLSTSDEVLSGYGLSFVADTYPEIRYTTISGGGAGWVQINVQDSGGTSLPDQTGNAGRFLTTDGTDVSWGEALVNNSVSKNSVVIGSKNDIDNAYQTAVVIGSGTHSVSSGGIAIGEKTDAYGLESTVIGSQAKVSDSLANGSVAIGARAFVNAPGAIQLSAMATGYSGAASNTDANTFKVANQNGNFEMMDENGNVPLERLTYVTNQIGDISTALTAILGE